MAEREGGFGSGFNKDKKPAAGARKPRGPRGAGESKAWVPLTNLGRLVADGKIKSLEEIYLHSIPIKEAGIIDYFFPAGTLKDQVMKIMPVQKMTSAGQRTKFKAFVAVGDSQGHVGLGSKVSKEVAGAIRGAITAAKLSIIPVRRGYYANRLGDPHTVPMKVTGKCGSVRLRLIPAPRGSQIVGAPVSKTLITLAGVKDCFSSSEGKTKTRGNFLFATFDALAQTYTVLTKDFWPQQSIPKGLFDEWAEYLRKTKSKGTAQLMKA